MSSARRVVLVGAGHAHVLVLERWARSPLHGAEVVVVTDRSESTYSGMVPGYLAGDYRLDEARIPVLPLARAAGAELVVAEARRIDPAARRIELAGGNSLCWDLASLDIGSTVRSLDVAGARQHALATRPIDGFAEQIGSRITRLAGRRARIAIVGGGAAGIEIAFTLRARLAAAGPEPAVTVVSGPDGLLPSYPERARRVALREAEASGIRICSTPPIRCVDAGGVAFDGSRIDADIVIWATGAAAPRMVADSPLPHDGHGFVRVRATLEVPGVAGLFAAGDCASIEGAEDTPKAGVHAVRAAPVLEANLRAMLEGRPLQEFHPQRHFLSLFNLGDRRALATKWDLAFAGRLAWIAKDRIDRGFVRRLSLPPQPSAGDAGAHRPDRTPAPR